MSGLVDLSPGAVFADQFRVVRPLARGGMGAVYVVEQLGTARERALKLMHPQIASDEKAIERFEREAKVASKIESDHVVEVIGAGVDRKTVTPWLCMELLKGETLADRVEKSGRLSRADTLEVVRQLGHALSAAHAAGIVHRDLKPENVFLATPRREGVPFTLKVLDFGVAALVADAQGAKTTQGVGSPMWMAPEQTNVGRVTPATDVWALGLIAFYLLTGKPYWRAPSVEGSSLTALLVEMMVEPMALASHRAKELMVGGLVPPTFDEWFSRAVDRDPTRRFPDARTAIPLLVALLEGDAGASASASGPGAFASTTLASALPATRDASALGVTVPASQLPTTPVPATSTSAPAAAPAPGRSATPGWVWGLAALLAVALLGAGALAMTLGGGPAPTTALPAATSAPLGAAGPSVDDAVAGSDDATGDDVDTAADDEASSDEAMDDEGAAEEEDVAGADADDEDETDDDEDRAGDDEHSDDDEDVVATPPPPPPHATRPRRAATSPAATAARRMLLDACWRGQFEGEPTPTPARWTFDFQLDAFGAGSNVRITGPSGGLYSAFRACVVTRVGQYHPTDGETHVEVTLP